MSLRRGLLDRLERGHEANAEARELRVVGLAIHVGAAAQGEPELERDRPAIELQHGETHDVIIRERDERSPMEPLARARPERRVIGSSFPAQRVQAEGVVEYRLDFGRTACQDDLDLTELSEGACPPANLSPP